MSDHPGSPVTNLDLIVAGHPLDPDARRLAIPPFV
jgi:hypothetical protein